MSRRRVLRALLALWLLALGASYVRWWTRGPAEVPAGLEQAQVPVFDGPAATGATLRLVWREAGSEDPAPLVLLHGSPGDLSNFDALVAALAGDTQVLTPDLPGFGLSSAALPDYSILAQAHELLAWLDAHGVERAHLVGWSLGGGVALHMGALEPERVASVTLLASIGVQELEWFGQYELNHAVHGAQLALWQALRFLAPHFGLADEARGYVRGFFDTDQRPLRGLLEAWQAPLLIVHGARDFLVPPAAAREHHRLVPHSELVLLEDQGHFLPWTWTEPLAAALLDFKRRVDAGAAPTRAQASAARAAAAAEPYDPSSAPPFSGLLLIVVMVMLVAATLISEDLTCFSAGLLVSQGRLEFVWATLACFIGIFIGDVGLFLLGRLLGRPALRRAPLRWLVTEEKVEQARLWFESRGALVIFLTRFMPGLRLPTYFAAGVVRTSLPVFAFWFVLAGMLWTPALVGIAAWVGHEAQDSLDLFGEYALWGVLGLLGLLVLLKRVVVPLLTWRGRRLLWGRLQRVWRWEFWPVWLFYLPVVGWMAWLSLRYRSLALVTCANPAIPTGGFIGESKSAILDGLGADDPRVARYVLLRAGDPARAEVGAAFAAEHGLPVVLKPDVGQRGSGVQVLRTPAHLAEALEHMPVDSVLQAFAPGDEFGVFYARRPSEDRGQILSITEKVIPTVTGDGVRTLEQLILADGRAVCQAQVYLDTNASRLDQVLPAGEEVALVDLGTHARGAQFLDGARVNTPELLDAIDDLSRQYEGFYFGRYDLRVPTEEQLARGEGFRVIELNGVTSESTHIYDPRHGLLHAWGTLLRQWSLAWAIARENADRGAPRATVLGTLRAWRAYRRAQRGHAARSRE